MLTAPGIPKLSPIQVLQGKIFRLPTTGEDADSVSAGHTKFARARVNRGYNSPDKRKIEGRGEVRGIPAP